VKVCNKCYIEKDVILFSKNKNYKDGLMPCCKECRKKYRNDPNRKNKELEYKRKYHIDNKEIEKQKYKDDIENQRKRSRDKYYKNKEKYIKYGSEYKSKKYKTDTMFRFKKKISTSILNIFKNKGFKKNGAKTTEILGCSIYEFKLYLESKFETWMTWENKGKYNGEFNYGWDIDHIIPLSTAKIEEDIIKLNHYTNLQPLCSKVNRDIKRDIF